MRQAKEKKLEKEKKPVTFPGWEAVEKEAQQQKPQIVITIKDSDGDVVRRITSAAKKGFHRIVWDLRYPAPEILSTSNKKRDNRTRGGILAIPGTYTATLSKIVDGKTTQLSGPVSFDVVPLREGTLKGAPFNEKEKFWKEISNTLKDAMALSQKVNKALSKTEAMQKALNNSTAVPGTLDKDLYILREKLLNMQTKLYGSKARNEAGEKNAPTVFSRISVLMMGTGNSTYGPTPMLQQTLDIAKTEFESLQQQMDEITKNTLPKLTEEIEKAGIIVVE